MKHKESLRVLSLFVSVVANASKYHGIWRAWAALAMNGLTAVGFCLHTVAHAHEEITSAIRS